jgi:hypothetical protein
LEKISAGYSSDWGLIFRIYEELKKLNIKITNNSISVWASELNTFEMKKYK